MDYIPNLIIATLAVVAFNLVLWAVAVRPGGWSELTWRTLAKMFSWPPIADWIIKRAQRTPYTHILSADGTRVYMGRWWLFNPYNTKVDTLPSGIRVFHKHCRWPRLPSIRVHNIRREDRDRHLHDHPWNARAIILRGGYIEERFVDDDSTQRYTRNHVRLRGDTQALRFGQYHRIHQLLDSDTWTLFFTWPWQGSWGFSVDGRKVHHDAYFTESKLTAALYDWPKNYGGTE
jgi:hypothetical protein